MKVSTFSVLLLLLFSAASHAANWSDFSLSYLNGSNYQVGDNDRQILTLEHAAGLSWGNTFTFVDRLEYDDGTNETYGEIGARYKLKNVHYSFVKTLYLAGQVEMGTRSNPDGTGSSFTNYLFGIGSDLTVPGFNFFQLNLYARNNERTDDNYQATFVWSIPLGPLDYGGFLDWASAPDQTRSTSFNLTSQLTYDIAPHIGLTDGKLKLGIEYVYWTNKFGLAFADERNVNLLVKYHF